jgi:hypothetical protein
MTNSVTIKNNGPYNIEILSVEESPGYSGSTGEELYTTETTCVVQPKLEPNEEVVLYLWQGHSLKINEIDFK